jgi:hypothetical protein
MAEKDISEKILESYNDVFADIMNVLLFHGEQIIQPESLTDTSVHAQYRANDRKLHELERDIAKKWKKRRILLALIGNENQTDREKFMPFRILGYDGNAYQSQYRKKAKKIVPVVTVVLYFGTKQHWNYPKNIKSLMDIPEKLEPYVNDYKANIFEIAWLSEKQVAMFRSDFRIVANFFVNKRKNQDYIPDDPTVIQHVDEVLKLLSAMTGDMRYENILSRKEKVTNMCEVAERLEQKGLKEGLKEGLAKGQTITIYTLIQKGKLTIEDGAEELNITPDRLKAEMSDAGYTIPNE